MELRSPNRFFTIRHVSEDLSPSDVVKWRWQGMMAPFIALARAIKYRRNDTIRFCVKVTSITIGFYLFMMLPVWVMVKYHVRPPHNLGFVLGITFVAWAMMAWTWIEEKFRS